ncbi:MAG: T9SS C-terminal target domain-containing protein, partial [Bacteroidetes bacterium]
DVTVTAPSNFQVSKDNTTFGATATYTVANFTTNATQTVYVRFAPTSGTNGLKEGNIEHNNFPTVKVAVSGTETGNSPTIQTSVANITFSTPVGTNQASTVQTYTLSVNNTALFTTGITVTAPTHFEVSRDGTTFSNSLAYTIADMATTQTVRVRFKPTGASDGTRTGNITHTSTGATTKNVGVTGTESLALAVETWANDFNISPNPTRSDLRFRCDAPARWIGADITFTDLAGKEVGKYVWANPSQTLQLHVRNWQKGTYLVRITAGKQSVVRKIVIL